MLMLMLMMMMMMMLLMMLLMLMMMMMMMVIKVVENNYRTLDNNAYTRYKQNDSNKIYLKGSTTLVSYAAGSNSLSI